MLSGLLFFAIGLIVEEDFCNLITLVSVLVPRRCVRAFIAFDKVLLTFLLCVVRFVDAAAVHVRWPSRGIGLLSKTSGDEGLSSQPST